MRSHLGSKHLDRHRAVQARVQGPVDDTHAALADLLDDAVVAEGVCCHLHACSVKLPRLAYNTARVGRANRIHPAMRYAPLRRRDAGGSSLTLSRFRTLAACVIVLPALTSCSSPERDWNAAAKQDSVQAYEAFLRKHPESEFGSSWRVNGWKRSPGRTLFERAPSEGYEKFLSDYPSSKNVSYAKATLDMMKSLAVTVVSHGVVPSASCFAAEADRP